MPCASTLPNASASTGRTETSLKSVPPLALPSSGSCGRRSALSARPDEASSRKADVRALALSPQGRGLWGEGDEEPVAPWPSPLRGEGSGERGAEEELEE